MGIHETIMRAAIADLTSIDNRDYAYGIFNTIYGSAWFIGSTTMGFLYDISNGYLFSFIVIIGIPAGILSDRIGRVRVIQLGWLIYA